MRFKPQSKGTHRMGQALSIHPRGKKAAPCTESWWLRPELVADRAKFQERAAQAHAVLESKTFAFVTCPSGEYAV